MSLNYLLWGLFGPVGWLVWLPFLAALLFLIGTPRAVRLARYAVFALSILVLVLAVLPTGDRLMARLEAPYPRPAALPSDIDAVAVLAGAEWLYTSTASGALEFGTHGERVSEALALARAYPAAKIWTVGGVEHAGRRDVDWTADYWRRAGLPAARIGKIGGTRDTCANARGIAQTLSGKRVLVVTSGFHMPRTMACMKAAGVVAVPYAVDRQSSGGFALTFIENIERADTALHEYAGLAWYRLTGRL